MSRVRRPFEYITALLVTLSIPCVASAQTPPPVDYSLNHAASVVGFTLYASAIIRIKREGQFKDFTGELSYDPLRPSETHVDLTVYTTSIDMNNTDHNDILRSSDFFDVERFPTMHFTSSGGELRPDGMLTVTGDLTIRGVTKRMAIPLKVSGGSAPSAFGSGTTFETQFEIDRTEFGLNGTPKWGGFNVSIGKKVQIHIAIAAVASARPPAR
jgi:polyisoprenoid-binding protein YceI